MRRMIERRLLNFFGIDKMPLYWSETMEYFSKDIQNAIDDNQMLALVAGVGAGKTILFNNVVMGAERTQFVYVSNFNKEKMDIGSIINAVIYDISTESPRRDLEARSKQVVRLLGKKYVDEKIKVCVIIEEAHRLHGNTLRSLKELRESVFKGVSPLFSVVLIGHPELLVKLESRKEAYWRTQVVELNENSGWMTYKERLNYVEVLFGEAITHEAKERVASLCKLPLEIDFYVENKMKEARKVNKKVLDSEVIKPTTMELKQAYDLSFREIAKEANLSLDTVNSVLRNPGHKRENQVLDAIEKVNARKQQIGNQAKAS